MSVSRVGLIGIGIVLGALAADNEPWRRLDWQTIERPHYRLHHVPGLSEDAAEVDALLTLVYEALIEEFGDHDPEGLLKRVDLDVYLQPQPMEFARPGTATTVATWSNGAYDADIHILSPSVYGQLDRSGFPPGFFGRDYYHKTLLHECSTLFMVPLGRAKRRGWDFGTCPPWFRQGYQDYLGLMRTSEHNRTVRLGEYRDTLADKTRVRLGLEVQEVYIDGAMLVKYMHDTWGAEKVQAVIVSPAPTFWEAIRRECGVTVQEFYDGWDKWRRKNRRRR